MEFPGLLRDFNLPSEVAQKFVVTMAAMVLVQIIQGPTHSSGNTPNLVFLSKQWQSVLSSQGGQAYWIDSLRRLMDSIGFQREAWG